MAEVESGTSVHLSDLNIGEDVTIIALTLGEDRDIPVASVTAKRGGGIGDNEEASRPKKHLPQRMLLQTTPPRASSAYCQCLLH